MAFFRLGHGQKRFLGSTHIDKQLLFSKFCSISSPSYLSGWVGYVDRSSNSRHRVVGLNKI